ncbi:hypothetical protein LTR53_008153 [Teratosphaeriaceae sp. CCFEE 6253]|nr:hypothetical protein LTR53_008153 [Teratosphaeriaceae sp. CCFEE 6253]
METDSTALTSQEREVTPHAEDAALEQQTPGADLQPLDTPTTPTTMDFTTEFDIITSRVATYFDSAAEPHFSDAEVIAIVLLLARGPLDFAQIIARMIQSFRYFANVAAEEIAHPQLNDRLKARVCRAISSYDLPLTSTRDTKLTGRRVINGKWHYELHKTQAFMLLHRHVSRFSTADYDANKPTLLFDLPPELRSNIWNHVLCFPESGLRMRYMPDTNHDGPPEITTITRIMDKPFRAYDWDRAQGQSIHTGGNLLYA